MQQICQRPEGRDPAGVVADGRLRVGPRGRDQGLAPVGQLQQQLHHPVPSHPAQHPQRLDLQRVTRPRDRHRRREVLETGSKSGRRSTASRMICSSRRSLTTPTSVGFCSTSSGGFGPHADAGRDSDSAGQGDPAGVADDAPNAMGNLPDCHPPCRSAAVSWSGCWGCARDRDAVPDGDLFGSDEDVLDEQPQDALAFVRRWRSRRWCAAGEEAFQVVGELEVDLRSASWASRAWIWLRRLVSRARRSGMRARSSSMVISCSRTRRSCG